MIKTYKYNGDIVDRKTFYEELRFDWECDRKCRYTFEELKKFFDTIGNEYKYLDCVSNYEIINGEGFETILQRSCRQ